MEISLLSYNTHLFLDSIVEYLPSDNIYKDRERLDDILKKLSDNSYDIIGLSEVWAHTIQNEIINHFKKNTLDGFAFQNEPKTKLSPGLVLGVRGSLDHSPLAFQYYTDLVGYDKYSAKGVVYGKVRIQNNDIYIIQTHTQASYTQSIVEDDKARRKQLQSVLFPIIDAALNEFNGPIFLLGDLNIIANSQEYQWFNQQMTYRGLYDAWSSCHDQNPGITYDPENNALIQKFDPTQKEKQRLDYIYYRKNKAHISHIKVIRDWKTDQNIDDSDHYPISANFHL